VRLLILFLMKPNFHKTHWEPLHAYFKETYGVDIVSYETLVLGAGKRFEQKKETKEKLREVVLGWDEWQISGKSRSGVYDSSGRRSGEIFLSPFNLKLGR
jgi:hypothetical protein